MKKLFTLCTALFALALIGCEDPADEMFAEIEDQQIEIIEDDNIKTSTIDESMEMD